jgi:hypothetical protein
MDTRFSRPFGAGRVPQQGLAGGAHGRPRANRWASVAALGTALVFSLALAAPADAQWPRPDRRRPPFGYGGYQYQPGYAQGYDDGYEQGREDARDRDRYDVRRHSRYRSADHGYDRRDGLAVSTGNTIVRASKPATTRATGSGRGTSAAGDGLVGGIRVRPGVPQGSTGCHRGSTGVRSRGSVPSRGSRRGSVLAPGPHGFGSPREFFRIARDPFCTTSCPTFSASPAN